MRLVLAALMCTATVPTNAAERCVARITKDIGAVEAPSAVLHRGDRYGPISQLRVDKKTGNAVYCEHGGYCYGTQAMDLISPCRFTRAEYSAEDDYSFTAQ